MAGLIQDQMQAPIAPAQEQPFAIERIDTSKMDVSKWGQRADGTAKGVGYFGALKRPDGGFSTELSAGVDFGHGEVEIPLLVPTLSRAEVAHLLKGGEPTDAIFEKAERFAIDRMKSGKSPFAAKDELYDVPEE